MLDLIVGYAVPAGLFVLMLITGTEVAAADFVRVAQHPRAVLAGVLGQLIVLPPLSFVVVSVIAPSSFMATALLLLALCPGGAISNYYCYLARCNVSLSATITAAGTLLCLVSIPAWLAVMGGFTTINRDLLDVPATRILVQLIAFMILPMSIGMVVRRFSPDFVSRNSRRMRFVSFAIVFAVLIVVAFTVRSEIASMAGQIALAATLFIVGAMLFGRLMAYGLKPDEGPVVVIESAVRNVGVALIVGRGLLGESLLGAFASFLTGYFIIELILIMAYAQFIRRRIAHAG